MMNKSHLGTADNPQDFVTSHDIGRLVDVVNVGKGFLRYVGPIHGKEGGFCGIELLEPNGKHDGSYQGVSYFIATPQHGIFAPIFRVTLDADEMKRQIPPATANRLSRSALPALQLRNSFTESESSQRKEPPKDIMSTSIYSNSTTAAKPIPIRPKETDPMQMSMFSDMMDGSMLSNGSWSDIADSMITSNCTFTVRRGPLIPNDDDSDLMSVPMVQSVLNIDREALRREEQLQSSVILGESRIGVEYLPIIEDENELETPLVETRTLPSSNYDPNANNINHTFSKNNPFVTTAPEVTTPKVETREEVTEAPEVENGNSQPSPCPSSQGSHASTKSSSKNDKENPPKIMETKPVEEPVTTTTKKEKQLPVSPPAPKFPVKPKAPSKHQMMMEQLKASIEAEKNKPKKEVKSRVSLLPPPPPKVVQKENREGEMTAETTPRRVTKQPLKAVNNKTKTSPAPPVERPKKERKPLYSAPPPKERPPEKEKEKVVISPPKSISAERKTVPSSAPSTSSIASAMTSQKNFPTSSFAGISKKRPSVGTTNGVKKQPKLIDEEQKLARLHNSNRAFEALVIVWREMNKKNDEKVKSIQDRYDLKSNELSELKKLLEDAKKKFEVEMEQLKSSNHQVVRNHANTMEDIQKRHEAQLAEKSKEYETNLGDEKSRRVAEMCAMSNRHQKVVACLDEKIAEAEKQCEQLKCDKKTLQAALANDCDHRNQMLTKEISSLQTALEMKSAEMKELRQKNQNLSLQVDEIPLKELEISKWRHKANEYKQMLDQKINGEKSLVQQIEDLRRKQIHDEEEKEAMRRSFDLMQFKYENGDEPNMTTTSLTESRFGTPTKVQFRSRSSASGTRPTSTNMSNGSGGAIGGDHRLSTSSHNGDHDSMTRSTISMYMSQVRLPENHAEDVIYAPDEIISSRSGSISQRLAIAIEDDGEPKIRSESDHGTDQSDSGIGLVM